MSDKVMFPDDAMTSVQPSYSDEEVTFVEGKGFGIRALAYIIDSVTIFAIIIGLSFFVGVFLGIILLFSGREIPTDIESTQFVDFVFGLVNILVYFTLFEGLFGASPGKLLTGLRVVKEDGSPCGIGAALYRGLWRFIDGIIFGAIAYFNMEPPLEQRLGDKKAHTVVVSSQEPMIQQRRDWPWFILALFTFMAFDTVVFTILTAVKLW